MNPAAICPSTATSTAGAARQTYLRWLAWAFTLSSTVRVAAYLPNIAVIVRQGDSSQHSLLCWITFCCAT